ncbi:cytidine deaminase [Marinomonas sp. MED121]|uniref:cytidine deaminase n=1 Tax=Marinomonas sp. MED121 TaxID=314277 RepID=UPI000069021A|nr:cytidine deaminase [Marinomonas sp. MED121]EAQ64342.1 cytidine deaminase [Marinomonas sp. MED121]
MKLDQKLVDAAINQALARFPTGYAGAGAVYTEDGQILTSVCFDTHNEIANLCHEAGAYCEANRLNLKVTASVCVSRSTPEDEFIILTPCGICQERLAIWGRFVEVAVPDPSNPNLWQVKTLDQVQPYYWGNIIEEFNT